MRTEDRSQKTEGRRQMTDLRVSGVRFQVSET